MLKNWPIYFPKDLKKIYLSLIDEEILKRVHTETLNIGHLKACLILRNLQNHPMLLLVKKTLLIELFLIVGSSNWIILKWKMQQIFQLWNWSFMKKKQMSQTNVRRHHHTIEKRLLYSNWAAQHLFTLRSRAQWPSYMPRPYLVVYSWNLHHPLEWNWCFEEH